MSLHDFVIRFGTTEACVDAIIQRRWPQGWSCPKCGGTRSYRLHSRRALQCSERSCRAQTSVTTGTVFEQLKTPLPKVFLAIYLMTDKQGISAMALSKHLGVAYNDKDQRARGPVAWIGQRTWRAIGKPARRA